MPARRAGLSRYPHFFGSRELSRSHLDRRLEPLGDETKLRRDLLRISQALRERSIGFGQRERSHADTVFADAHELHGFFRSRLLNDSGDFAPPSAG